MGEIRGEWSGQAIVEVCLGRRLLVCRRVWMQMTELDGNELEKRFPCVLLTDMQEAKKPIGMTAFDHSEVVEREKLI